MTDLLEQAIARLNTLPTDKQDAIVTLILAELEVACVAWATHAIISCAIAFSAAI